MDVPSLQSTGLDLNAIITTLAGHPDPLQFLTEYLEKQRIPPQGPFFRIHALAALAIHGW